MQFDIVTGDFSMKTAIFTKCPCRNGLKAIPFGWNRLPNVDKDFLCFFFCFCYFNLILYFPSEIQSIYSEIKVEALK
jgi:hypothetical protein